MDNKRPENNPISTPNRIEGIDHLIMTRVANYISEHPEQTPENKREAFAHTFSLIEAMLKVDKDIPVKELEKAYKTMATSINFSYEQNRTFNKFKNYLDRSREYMKELDRLPRLELFKELTGLELSPEERGNFQIRRGAFAFEISANQRIINMIVNRGKPSTTLGELKEMLFPDTGTYGVSHYISDPNNERVRANFIVFPRKDSNLLEVGGNAISDIKRLEMYLDNGIDFKLSENSRESIKTHEYQHAIFNTLEFSHRYENPIDVKQELKEILQTTNPQFIKEQDFHLFCDYLVKTTFISHAANEILANLKEKNMVARVGILTDLKLYDFTQPQHGANLEEENELIRNIINDIFGGKTPNDANKFMKIYSSFSEQATKKINRTVRLVAICIDKYNLDEEKLANVLMFENFENWVKVLGAITSNPNSSIIRKTK